MSISLIACVDLNRGLGYKNQLLCHLPNDLRHFRELTTGQFCVFGRKTYESIGKPLPNRQNIVITRDNKYVSQDVFVYNSLTDVIFEYESYNDNENELFICGGAEIYHQALPYSQKIYLTIIDHEFPHVDTFFPAFSMKDWKPIENIKNPADKNNPYDHYFVTYERKI
jgi:dihydrofolate reductase